MKVFNCCRKDSVFLTFNKHTLVRIINPNYFCKKTSIRINPIDAFVNYIRKL